MFSKDCPQCGKDNAAYAVRCACGYLFGAMEDSVETDDGHAQTVQEEKLYEEYLKARAEQAASSARETARIAATQPGNRVRVEQAAQAKLAAAKVEAELAAQRAKLDAVTPNPPKTGVEAPAQETAARPKSASPMPAPATTGDARLKLEPRATAENYMPAPARPDPAAVAKSNAAAPTRHPVAAAKAAAAVQAQKLAQALRSAQAKKAAAKVKSPQPQRAGADSTREEAPSPDKPNLAALAASPKTPQTARANETTGVTDSTSKSHEAGTSLPRDHRPRVDPLRASASEACPADMARSQGLARALAVKPQDTNPQPARTATQATEPNIVKETPVPLASGNTADRTRPAQPQQTAPVTRADAGTAGLMAEQPRTPQATAVRAGGVATRRADKARATSDATPRNGAVHAPHPESAQTPASAPANHAQHELQAALETLTARAPTAAPDESPQGVATPDGASTPEPHVPDAAPVNMPDSAGPTVATPPEIPQQADVKDCPNCTALLPIDAERCRCGFAFVRVDERMPSLSLSDSDVAALDGPMPSARITPLG